MNGRLRILSKLKVDEKRKCWRFIFIRTNILSAVSFFFIIVSASVLPVAQKVSWLISFSVDSRVHFLARIYYLLVINIVFVRFVVPFLLLLFKWWLVYQHDRSVCMGILGEWGRDCVELRVAQQRCPVYMRVSRTSGRFRETSGCTLKEVWCPSTSAKSLHSTRERKTT